MAESCVHEVNNQTRSENVDPAGVSHVPGIRKVGLRAEIDTSPPFRSVREAVNRFGGRGYWVPFKLKDNYNGVGDFNIKRMKEHAVELEKELIVKELETLDVLEALGSTKRIVKDLKHQLHQESLRSAERNEHCNHNPMSTPDLILMQLKQAKINLGKTMDDLVKIQSSVESLSKKMKEEKDFLDKTRAKLMYGFGEAVSLADKQNMNCMRTAEMRLVAARKMEEAARAAEALAIAEITMLSSSKDESEEIANVKQLAAENAFCEWTKDSPKGFNSKHVSQMRHSLSNISKSVLKSNVSMGDVLRRKQVPNEDVVVSEREEVHEEKQYVKHRRKFGFIHITLPRQKHSKKKSSV